MNDKAVPMIEHLLNQLGKENQEAIEDAMKNALLYGSATVNVEGGGTVTWSSPQNPSYWGDSLINITAKAWEEEVDFD